MPIESLCGWFGFSKQAYYHCQQTTQRTKQKSTQLLQQIRHYRQQLTRFGIRKLHHLLNLVGYRVRRDALFALLRSKAPEEVWGKYLLTCRGNY